MLKSDFSLIQSPLLVDYYSYPADITKFTSEVID